MQLNRMEDAHALHETSCFLQNHNQSKIAMQFSPRPASTVAGMLFLFWITYRTHFCPDFIKIHKIHQRRKCRGFWNYHLVTISIGISQINLNSLLRYGNPDIQFLGSLKNKIWIHNIWSVLIMNLTPDFISNNFFSFWFRIWLKYGNPELKKYFLILYVAIRLWIIRLIFLPTPNFDFIFTLRSYKGYHISEGY